MAFEDLLKGILGGGMTGGQGGAEARLDLTDLLGGILGGMGGEAPQPSASPQGSAGLPDLIGGILGGLGQGGDLGGALGGILGGSNMTNNAILGPISQALSEQLGLDPKVAQMVVIFALTTVIPAILGRMQKGHTQQGAMPSGALPAPQEGNALDLDDLLEQMGSQRAVGREYLQSTGLTQRLSAQTGLDPETAEESLQQTLFMLGQFLDNDAPSSQMEESDLKSLLDE
jgi:hypothetical protein